MLAKGDTVNSPTSWRVYYLRLYYGRARQNRTAVIPTPRVRTAVILWPAYITIYLFLYIPLIHFVQALMRVPAGMPHFE